MVTTTANIFLHPVPCCSPDPDDPTLCICGREERVLRGYIMGYGALPPMTADERVWCLDEIGAVEGYNRDDYQDATDADLARGVLSAWTDYARDKGLL